MNHQNQLRPLCVDLDGTLILGDVTYETFILYLKAHPHHLFLPLFWLLTRGKAYCKEKLVEGIQLNDFTVPINEEVLAYCQDQFKNDHRDIYIVSGGHEQVVQRLAHQWSFVRGVWGTSEKLNLISKNKANFLVQKFGEKGFDYIGNSSQDIAVWKVAHDALAVVPSSRTARTLFESKIPNPNLVKTFSGYKNPMLGFLRSLRTSHWGKNLLLFVPLLLSPLSGVGILWWKVALASILFSLICSATYILNDLFDMQSDRRHQQKKGRPLAAGELPCSWGVWSFIILALSGMIGAVLLSPGLALIFLAYFPLNFIYTFVGKRIPIVDVFFTVAFYMLRLYSGGVVAGVELSPWLEVFAFFFFLNLAHLKRYRELWELCFVHGRYQMSDRSYKASDLPHLFHFGSTSGLCAVVIYALLIYQQAQSSTITFGIALSHPDWLWPGVILLTFWIMTVWFMAQRGKLRHNEHWFSGAVLALGMIGLFLLAK